MGRHARREHLHYFLANPNQYHPCGENSTEPSQTTDRQVAHADPNNLPVTHRLPIENNTVTAIPAEGPITGTLDRSFGEVQQDLFLSCLTIGQAYCLLEVLK